MVKVGTKINKKMVNRKKCAVESNTSQKAYTKKKKTLQSSLQKMMVNKTKNWYNQNIVLLQEKDKNFLPFTSKYKQRHYIVWGFFCTTDIIICRVEVHILT